MGWFLTKKKNKRRRRHTPATLEAGSWHPHHTLKRLKLVAVAALVVSLAVGWGYAKRHLITYAAAGEGGGIDADRVELVDAPQWMNPIIKHELCQLVADQVGQDPFHHDGLERAALILSVSPWVDRVHHIRRVPGNRLQVAAQYRTPIAVVEGRDGYHLVSAHGVRLPGLYLHTQLEELGLPVVIGVAQAPGAAGQVWPCPDLHAGLDLVRLLANEPYTQQIKYIDVSARDAHGRIRLALRTQRGLVRWGLPPGKEQAIEPDAQTKMAWLNDVYRQRGAIDAGGKIVDIYGATVFVHQPTHRDSRLGAGYTFSR